MSLSTDVLARDTTSTEADIVIHYGTGGYSGLHAELLIRETMSPVCTPEIAAQIDTAEDLGRFTQLVDLIVADNPEPYWDFWARETGTALPRFERTRSFAQANMVIQAAVEGLGVAIGRTALTADAIKKGQLVHPLDAHAVSQSGYWMVCESEALKNPKVRAFCDWLRIEAAETSESI